MFSRKYFLSLLRVRAKLWAYNVWANFVEAIILSLISKDRNWALRWVVCIMFSRNYLSVWVHSVGDEFYASGEFQVTIWVWIHSMGAVFDAEKFMLYFWLFKLVYQKAHATRHTRLSIKFLNSKEYIKIPKKVSSHEDKTLPHPVLSFPTPA